MNVQNSKKILFNKSTLLSLKAELIKKQEEIQEKKQLPQHKPENFKPTAKSSINETNTIKTDKLSFRDRLKANDIEELEACRKTKLALEKKAVLYEHLSDSTATSQLAGRFLVDFDNKNREEDQNKVLERYTTTPENKNHEEQIENYEDDSEWMEFTDCLGRSRKCLKSEIDLYLKRDAELMRAMDLPPDPDSKLNHEPNTEKPLLVQTTNDYLQSLREKWEQKEREMLNKDKDIHYQDLLFDEARMHGTAYYSFSTDEGERRKQMEELMRTREETQRAQKEAEEKRKKRDELMAARVAAARARQRLRAGLPPEDPDKNKKDFTACLLELLNKQKDEADNKAKEKERQEKKEQEKERKKLREAYVREWDVGKEGVEEKLKKFRQMTQEDYVEQQRSKRIDEFAPPQTLSGDNNSCTFDNTGRFISSDIQNKTWADVLPKPKTPPPPVISDTCDNKGLYFSSRKPTSLKYKNFVKDQETIPIEIELSDDEITEIDMKRKFNPTHAEIALPPKYDYYGPKPKKEKSQKPFDSDMNEAFAQGAKSLKTVSSNRHLSKNYDFTFD